MSLTGFLSDNRTAQTIRSRVAFHSRQHGFDKAAKQLVAGASAAATDRLVADLYAYWGDPLTQGDERFLRSCLAEAQKTDGAILQCGTGLLTLLLGAVCDQSDKRGKQLWCLDDDRHWCSVMRSWLTEYQIRKAHIIHSPPRLFQEYVWYSTDPQRLAKQYSLLLCDGARASVSGAVGCATRLANRLSDDFVLLARNVTRPADLKYLHVWAKSRNGACVMVDKESGFIKVSTRQPAENAFPETPAVPRKGATPQQKAPPSP